MWVLILVEGRDIFGSGSMNFLSIFGLSQVLNSFLVGVLIMWLMDRFRFVCILVVVIGSFFVKNIFKCF